MSVRASTGSPRACSGDMYLVVLITMPGIVSGFTSSCTRACGPSAGEDHTPTGASVKACETKPLRQYQHCATMASSRTPDMVTDG